jgi:hypothetical protein
MAQTRTAGVRALLALAHVLIGPFCAGLVFVASHFGLTGGPLILRPNAEGVHGLSSLLAEYIGLTPIFYAPGFLPALTTGLLTASRVWKTGRCTWLWAATCGAVTSAIFVGAPSLVFVREAARSLQIGYVSAVVVMLGFQAALGFIGTIPVWLATGVLRNRLAAARPAAGPTLAAAV